MALREDNIERKPLGAEPVPLRGELDCKDDRGCVFLKREREREREHARAHVGSFDAAASAATSGRLYMLALVMHARSRAC